MRPRLVKAWDAHPYAAGVALGLVWLLPLFARLALA